MTPLFPALLLAAAANWVPMRWNSADAKSLDLLAGTPVNYLLVSERSPELVRAAEARGITVVTTAEVPLPSRTGLKWNSTAAVLATSQGVWAGIRPQDDAVSGPTSAPWIDTNAGFLRFARASSKVAIWIAHTPPAGEPQPLARYLQAIADAGINGARWVVSLDPTFERKLLAHEPAAVAAWKRMARHMAYFEDHKEWRNYLPFGDFALIQDESNGALVSGGIMDMLAALHIPARSVPPARTDGAAMDGVRMALNLTGRPLPPRPGMRELLPDRGWSFPIPPPGRFLLRDTELQRLESIHKLVDTVTARQNFGVRLFNMSGLLSNALTSPDRRTIAVHLANYTDYPAEAITAHFRGPWKHALLLTPEAPPKDLTVYATKDGTGVEIERVATVATLVVE